MAYSTPFVDYYHSHPAYHHYPAVNMSQQGAALYCQWLTQVYNARPDRKYQEVVFRLPTPEEMAIAIGKGMGWQGVPEASADMPPAYFRNDKGQLTANFRVIRQDAIREDGLRRDSLVVEETGYYANEAVVTAPVKSYEPNALGIYNLQGNVAEWTTSANVAMGGSYLTTGWYLLPGRELERDGTQGHPDTGFRYVVEVITP